MNRNYLELLKEQFNHRINFKEKRPGIMQLIAPFYHEDGDMLDIFIQDSPESGKIRICDYGMSLMHLSYSYDIDTQNKERIFQRIVSENNLNEENGNIYIDVNPEHLYTAILQFAQTIAKVSSMRQFKREVVQSLFYEALEDFIINQLKDYNPTLSLQPLPERDDLEVDYALNVGKRPIYVFGVKDVAKARLTTICCLEFQRAKIPFRSIAVHQEFEALPRKDRSRLTSAIDKQFISLEDFQENVFQYLERETA